MSDVAKWDPIESSPEVLTDYCHKLGLEDGAEFVDVYGLDDDLLMLVPGEVLALLVQFPLTPETRSRIASEDKAYFTPETTAALSQPSPFYLKQFISNACGTIGCLHCLCNCIQTGKAAVKEGSFLDKYMKRCADLETPRERGLALMEFPELETMHRAAAAGGQSQMAGEGVPVEVHYTVFVEVGGVLYELDGRRPGPIAQGKCERTTLLKESAEVMKKIIAANPNENRYSFVALVKQ